jgi:hypothetical protein
MLFQLHTYIDSAEMDMKIFITVCKSLEAVSSRILQVTVSKFATILPRFKLGAWQHHLALYVCTTDQLTLSECD